MAVRKPLDLERELLEAFEHSGRVTEHLVRVLRPGVWRASPPAGRGRTIPAIVAHMQGVRRGFARMGGAAVVPPALDRTTSTQAQGLRAIQHSNEALAQLFGAALVRGDGRIKGLPRRVVNRWSTSFSTTRIIAARSVRWPARTAKSSRRTR